MVEQELPKDLTLIGKIWRSLVALAVLFGLVNATSVKLSLNLWLFSIATFVFFAVFWHLIECKNKIVKYFKELKMSIHEIREEVMKIKKRGQLGNLATNMRDIIIAAILLYIFLLIIQALANS